MTRYLLLIAGLLAGLGAHATVPDPAQTARSYFAEGDYINAAKHFEDVLRAFPSDASVMNNLAVAKAANGEYQAALALLRRAAQLAPHRPDIEDNLRHLQDYLQYFDRVRPRSGNDDMLSDPPALWSEPGARVRKVDGNKCTRKTCK